MNLHTSECLFTLLDNPASLLENYTSVEKIIICCPLMKICTLLEIITSQQFSLMFSSKAP